MRTKGSLSHQIAAMLLAVCLVSATLTWTLATGAIDAALPTATETDRGRMHAALGVAVGIAVLCTSVAALGAVAFLRSSIRGAVLEMLAGTEALAVGRFQHRVASRRRDELGALAAGVDRLAEQLAELDRARARMIAAVSHELRTPLTIIRGHAFTLARSEQDPQRIARLQVVDDEVERLAGLIDDLLEAASEQARVSERVEYTKVSTRDLLGDTLRRFRVIAAEAGVELVTRDDRDLTVSCDVRRLGQAIDNLVANAIRHATKGSSITIAVQAHQAEAHIAVSNQGVEVSPSDRERIFEPFVQGAEGGGRMGLGLFVARAVARAHGGDVQVESAANTTTFVLSIPAQRYVATGLGQHVTRWDPRPALGGA